MIQQPNARIGQRNASVIQNRRQIQTIYRLHARLWLKEITDYIVFEVYVVSKSTETTENWNAEMSKSILKLIKIGRLSKIFWHDRFAPATSVKLSVFINHLAANLKFQPCYSVPKSNLSGFKTFKTVSSIANHDAA